MARIAAAVGIAKIAPAIPATAVPMMTTANTATGLMLTAAPITSCVTTSWIATAAIRLMTRLCATTSGASTTAKAGNTAQPSSGPIHGMNTMSPAMTAMSGPYGTPSANAASRMTTP